MGLNSERNEWVGVTVTSNFLKDFQNMFRCVRCSLRDEAEVFISPDMRLAAVLRQFCSGGGDLGFGREGGMCSGVHRAWCLGYQGLIMLRQCQVIYWIWSSYYGKTSLKINVWYKILSASLFKDTAGSRMYNLVYYSYLVILCHNSHNTVIINDTLCVHSSKHKSKVHITWHSWAVGFLIAHVPRQQTHGVVKAVGRLVPFKLHKCPSALL